MADFTKGELEVIEQALVSAGCFHSAVRVPAELYQKVFRLRNEAPCRSPRSAPLPGKVFTVGEQYLVNCPGHYADGKRASLEYIHPTSMMGTMRTMEGGYPIYFAVRLDELIEINKSRA